MSNRREMWDKTRKHFEQQICSSLGARPELLRPDPDLIDELSRFGMDEAKQGADRTVRVTRTGQRYAISPELARAFDQIGKEECDIDALAVSLKKPMDPRLADRPRCAGPMICKGESRS